MTHAVGLLQAIVEAIGESDTDIGGLFSTRLISVVPAGSISLPVESTLGWSSSGRVSLEGRVYTYDSLTLTTLDGIKRNDNGTIVPGTAKDHRDESEVVDLTRTRSALDQVRRALLVEYAEGDDLNTLGRNLNVLRSPFLAQDDRFRKIVKALAYNPRGTMHGLELALDGLVDPGNYEIFEDLVNFPCTIFIRLVGAAATEDISVGKAFNNSGLSRPAATDNTVVLPSTPLTVQNVLWKDEAKATDCRNAKPSADMIVEYTGQTPQQVWQFVGANEAADVIVTPGQYTEIQDNGGIAITTYERLGRIQPESNVDMEVLFLLPSSATFFPGYPFRKQWYFAFHDTVREIGIGVVHVSPTTYWLGVAGVAGFASGTVTLQYDVMYAISIHKRGANKIELRVNGTLALTGTYTSLPTSTEHKFVFGCGATGGSGARSRVKSVEIHATTLTDYWNSRGTSADVNSATPTQIDVNLVGHFAAALDPGKQFDIRGSAIVNAQGGNNNGSWIVDSVVSTEEATLIGPTHLTDALLQTVVPVRIVVATPDAFQFPDDLGKKIEIMGSILGNDGVYVIDKLLDPTTFADLQSATTQIPSQTNVCEVVAAAFVTEPSLDWRLIPDFTTESGLDWEMSAAGQVSITTLLLRQNLPITTPLYERILNIIYTDVLSGQIMKDNTVENEVIDEGPPPLYSYYPFYVTDPLGFVRSYLDAITAAGVIPEFRIV